jgi:hypothetical protein
MAYGPELLWGLNALRTDMQRDILGAQSTATPTSYGISGLKLLVYEAVSY